MDTDKGIIKFNPQKVKNIVRKRIANNRKETQKLIANGMGLTVARLFSTNPTANRLAQIATGLGVDVNSFFDIPPTFLLQGDDNVLSDVILEYEGIKKDDFYRKMYEKQMQITKLLEENTKYRMILQKLNYPLDEIDFEEESSNEWPVKSTSNK